MIVAGVPDSKIEDVVDISFLYGLLEVFSGRRVDLGMNVVALFMKKMKTQVMRPTAGSILQIKLNNTICK